MVLWVLVMALNPDTAEYLRGIARELSALGHGERGAVVERAAQHLGWSKSRVYNQLKSTCGWSSERKARADRGTTKQDLKALETIAALQHVGMRKNGKQVMQTPLAIAVAMGNGAAVTVSKSRINALMRQRKMDVRSQRSASAAIEMRSLYPNHVHQVDPSLCLVYYLNGKQHIISDDKLYKNKLDALAKVQFKCWRYVLVDHASNVIVVRYYIGAGESQENMADFLLYAWGRKPNAPYHGVPSMLYWDKGSANTAAMVRNMLDALDVRHETHAPGNARAKGAVEGANNTVETKFEALLKTHPVADVDELNMRSEQWSVAYNGNMIPNYDSRLRRRGLPVPTARTDLWLLIRADQLRELPDPAACRITLEGKELSRKVKNLRISYKHPRAEKSREYLLGDCDGVSDGDSVMVAPLLYGDCRIVVRAKRYDGEDLSWRIEPVPADGHDQFGQATSAPVIGERYAASPDTIADKAAKQLDERAYPGMTQKEIKKAKSKNATPLPDVDGFAVLDQAKTATYMPRNGTVIPLAMDVDAAEKPMSRIKAMIAIGSALGRDLTANENSAIRSAYPDGMLQAEVDAWVAKAKAVPALRLVGGE